MGAALLARAVEERLRERMVMLIVCVGGILALNMDKRRRGEETELCDRGNTIRGEYLGRGRVGGRSGAGTGV
jgi:hypothetical protein